MTTFETVSARLAYQMAAAPSGEQFTVVFNNKGWREFAATIRSPFDIELSPFPTSIKDRVVRRYMGATLYIGKQPELFRIVVR